MDIHKLGRLARTVKHLRTSQLFWRGRYALSRRLPAPHISVPSAIANAESNTKRSENLFSSIPVFHHPGPIGPATIEQLAGGEFDFLNRTETIGFDVPDWKLGPQSRDRLWTITLHYHAWCYTLAEAIANSDNDEARRAEELFVHYLDDWITRCDLNTEGARDLAWNSYAISTRIGWWIRSYLKLGPDWWNSRPEFHHAFLTSLWRQAEFVVGHLEWDLRANHLLRNAVGLAWAARFFSGNRPNEWLQRATSITQTQLKEQVADDGGHFERSPMYHLHIMDDVLSLAMLLKESDIRQQSIETWRKMADYLSWMRHPDGGIPLFNDAALNAASAPAAMLEHAHLCGIETDVPAKRGGRHFLETGMVVWHGSPWALFFDVGEVGADCQPGHAHADTLGVECSVHGQRLFVDPGTYGYDHDAKRHYDRSTSAHNTVCIDGADSSEVWHIFRVGARAKPVDTRVDIKNDTMTASAAHNGYDRLSGSPRHRRTVTVNDGTELRIVDRVDGNNAHTIEGGYLLASEWRAEPTASGWNLTNGTDQILVLMKSENDIALAVEQRPWHPEFGLEVMTQRLTWRWQGKPPLEVTTIVKVN